MIIIINILRNTFRFRVLHVLLFGLRKTYRSAHRSRLCIVRSLRVRVLRGDVFREEVTSGRYVPEGSTFMGRTRQNILTKSVAIVKTNIIIYLLLAIGKTVYNYNNITSLLFVVDKNN